MRVLPPLLLMLLLATPATLRLVSPLVPQVTPQRRLMLLRTRLMPLLTPRKPERLV
jgi:hypothetical protein